MCSSKSSCGRIAKVEVEFRISLKAPSLRLLHPCVISQAPSSPLPPKISTSQGLWIATVQQYLGLEFLKTMIPVVLKAANLQSKRMTHSLVTAAFTQPCGNFHQNRALNWLDLKGTISDHNFCLRMSRYVRFYLAHTRNPTSGAIPQANLSFYPVCFDSSIYRNHTSVIPPMSGRTRSTSVPPQFVSRYPRPSESHSICSVVFNSNLRGEAASDLTPTH